MTTRRECLLAFGAGALAVSFNSLAQKARPHRIGFLSPASASGLASRVDALRHGLSQLGYTDGKNIVFEFRWGDGNADRLAALAAELVRSKVDVLVTHAAPGTRAAKAATTTIPIVMAVAGDAVATGLVSDLARPGGNVTGSTYFGPELTVKRLEILKEVMPRLAKVAVLHNPDNPVNGPTLQHAEASAKSLGLTIERCEVRGPGELEAALGVVVKRHADALAVVEESTSIVSAKKIAELAAKLRLPSIGFTEYADVGGMIGYGANLLEMWRRSAYFIDRILKGAKPADLPVERPTKFEFIVNVVTTKQLGISISPAVLIRADRTVTTSVAN